MCQILVTGDLASSESQARPNAAEPASIDLTNEDYDKEQDKEEDKEEEQEEEKEKEQEEEEKEQKEEEGQEKENDQEEEGKEEEMVTIEVEVADSPDAANDGNPEEYQDCEEYRTDMVPPPPPPGPPPKKTANKNKELFLEGWGDDTWGRWQNWQAEEEGESHEKKGEKEEDVKEDGKNKAGEPFLDDDRDWHEEVNVWRWWAANFGAGESHEWKDEKEEVKDLDPVKEEEVSDEAEGEKDDEQMPGDDASYVSSEEVDGFDLLRDDVM